MFKLCTPACAPASLEKKRELYAETDYGGLFQVDADDSRSVIQQLRAAVMQSGRLHFSYRRRSDQKDWQLVIRSESQAGSSAGFSKDILIKLLRQWVQVVWTLYKGRFYLGYCYYHYYYSCSY
jgi:hypothetical protein